MSVAKLAAKFSVNAIKEWNPFGPAAIVRRHENKAFRKAFRKARKCKPLTPEEERLMSHNSVKVTLPDGTTYNRVEPVIPVTTSTKVAVGTGVVAAFPAVELLEWVQSIEFSTTWLEAATNSPYFIYYGGLLIAWAIAKISKSPFRPKAP